MARCSRPPAGTASRHDVGVEATALILDTVVKQAAAQLSGRYRIDGTGWVAMHTVACLANADLPRKRPNTPRRCGPRAGA